MGTGGGGDKIFGLGLFSFFSKGWNQLDLQKFKVFKQPHRLWDGPRKAIPVEEAAETNGQISILPQSIDVIHLHVNQGHLVVE